MSRQPRRAGILAFVVALAAQPQAAPAQTAATADIVGTTNDAGSAPLAGVELVLLPSTSDTPSARTTSASDGAFSLRHLKADSYRLRATLHGFATLEIPVLLTAGQHLRFVLRLDPLALSDRAAVVGVGASETDHAATREVVPASLLEMAPLTNDRFLSLLPKLPGVVRDQDGHISMKGGRPNQSGLQVGSASAIDPFTGDWGYALPLAAIDEIDVTPNTYLANIGRFTSGVTQIQTRQGTNEWRPSASGLFPIPRWRHGAITGINSWNPGLAIAGPLVKDRLFLEESVEYETDRTPVGSLPDNADETRFTRVNTFTRLDAVLSPQHWLTTTATMFPSHTHYLGLSPFSPQSVSPAADQQGLELGASEIASLGSRSLLESGATVRGYDVDIIPGGSSPMDIAPDGRSGNFFNTQHRTSSTAQWTETLTTSAAGPAGQHLFSVGVDVLHARVDGTSSSAPVIVRRADGTTSQRVAFAGVGIQQAASTELSAFGQDRWRVSNRASLEFGLRWDRDGVFHRDNWAPRLGASFAVLADGRGIVRGGYGWFYGRTPLNIAAFGSYEIATVTSFAADGVTPLAPPVVFSQRSAGDLQTAKSASWSVEYDHQWTPSILLRVNHFERQGTHEPLLEPIETAASAAWLLDDRGRSRYRETEITMRYGPRRGADVNVSYVHSHAEGDLNAFDSFFSNVRNPIVRPNEYSLTNIDVPHRLLIRGRVPIGGDWAVAPLVEARSGFPYSVVDQDQNFVGARNSGHRFPALCTVDLGLDRLITIRHRELWVGIRVSHILNGFTPRDVQNNINSPAFGTFYNGIPRRYGLSFYIQP